MFYKKFSLMCRFLSQLLRIWYNFGIKEWSFQFVRWYRHMAKPMFTADLFHMMFNHSMDYLFLMKKVDDNYQYIAVNDSVHRLFQQDVTNLLITDILDAATVRFMKPYYDEALQYHKQVCYQDYTHFRVAQKFETTLYPFIQQDGHYVLACTKELRYERALTDYYLFTRSLLFNSYLSTIMLSNDGIVYEFSSKVLDEMGLLKEQLIGKHFYELPMFSDATKQQLKQTFQRVNNGEHFQSQLLEMQLADETKYFLLTMNAIRDREDMDAIFIVLQDVTDYQRKTEELHHALYEVERLQEAMNSTLEIVITDTHGYIMEANEPYCRTAKYTQQELKGRNISLLRSRAQSFTYFKSVWNDYLMQGKTWRGEVCNMTKYGEPYWLDMTILPIRDEHGDIVQFMSINLNITEKKAVMNELKQVGQMFETITENTRDFIAIANEDGILQYISPSYEKLLQYKPHELHQAFYASILTSASTKKWYHELYNRFTKAGQYTMEFELVGRDGRVHLIESNISVVLHTLRPNVRQIMMISREITARKQKETELLYMAYHDGLTGIPNRRYLLEQFPQLKKDALQYNESMAFLYLDGDNFKHVNDTYGHDVGDQFLQQFGQALRQSVRAHDIVIRLGGDEFLIIMPGLVRDKDIRRQQVENVVADVHMRLVKGWQIGIHSFTPTSSIGVAFFPENSMELERLVDAADEALLAAKQRGKNAVMFYEQLKL